MKQRYGSEIYGRYGFVDAFNPSFAFTDVKLTHGRIAPGVGWVDTDQLGIDQGPLLAMLGNYRGEVVWQAMRRNAHLRRGLERAGFRGGGVGGLHEVQPPILDGARECHRGECGLGQHLFGGLRRS